MPTKFPEHEYLYPPVADSSRLLVGCSREDYSASRIAHAVEDCDAHLLNLNVTSFNTGYDADTYYADNSMFPVVFDIRESQRNADSIMRSLERYGYTVLDTEDAPGADNDTVRERIDLFFKYLEP